MENNNYFNDRKIHRQILPIFQHDLPTYINHNNLKNKDKERHFQVVIWFLATSSELCTTDYMLSTW